MPATHPALDVAMVSALLEVSPPAARTALATLAEHGILSPVDDPRSEAPGRPAHRWVAKELLDLLTR